MRTNSWNAVGQPASAGRRASTSLGRRGPTSAAAVRELIEATVSGLGYELVEVQWAVHGLLRITVDTSTPPGAIGLDDCERVSRQLSHLFAVEQIDYERLEVGSPGLDRPLLEPRDFVRFAGAPVQIQLKGLLHGRRRFQGRLLGLTGPAGSERAVLAVDSAAGGRARPVRGAKAKNPPPVEPQAPIELPLADIEKARLVPQLDFRGGVKAPQANREGQR